MASADTQAAEVPQPPAEQAASKGKSKVWLWIVLAAVLAAGGTAGAIMMLGGGDAAEAKATEGEAPETTPPGLVSLDTFLVNLNDADGEHYLKLTLRLGIVPATRAEQLNGDVLQRARIRDRILTVLTAKTFADIGSPVGKEGLRREIQAQVNTLLGEDGQVQDVLFSEFVVQ